MRQLPRGPQRRRIVHRATGRIYAPVHLFRIDAKQIRLPRRGAPAEGRGRSPQSRRAGDGEARGLRAMSDHVIDVSGLRKSFGDLKVVEGLSLQVAEGEICGFLGANGSGKTTTIRMLCGLLKPDGGSGHCLGYDIIRQPHEIRPQVGYMAQRFSLYEDLTTFENLDFVARVYEMRDRRQA